jgi:Domain of unknown function (DUF4864)
MFILRSFLAALASLMFLQAAAAQTTETTPAGQARLVVEAQLDAFAADDARRAFSYATPGTRARFGSAENFLAMVRSGYPAVYRPASVSFLAAKIEADSVIQPVSIADDAGRLWIALYQLVRQPDSSWRIEGCQLIQQPGSRT